MMLRGLEEVAWVGLKLTLKENANVTLPALCKSSASGA